MTSKRSKRRARGRFRIESRRIADFEYFMLQKMLIDSFPSHEYLVPYDRYKVESPEDIPAPTTFLELPKTLTRSPLINSAFQQVEIGQRSMAALEKCGIFPLIRIRRKP